MADNVNVSISLTDLNDIIQKANDISIKCTSILRSANGISHKPANVALPLTANGLNAQLAKPISSNVFEMQIE